MSKNRLKKPVGEVNSNLHRLQISIANGDEGWITAVSRCDKIFTIGQRIGTKGCSIPTEGYDWLKTLPPVSLTDWLVNDSEEATNFTSVIRWQGFRNPHYGKLCTRLLNEIMIRIRRL